MPHNTVAVVGAAETTKLGVIPDVSRIARPLAFSTLTLREAHFGQNGRGGK